MAKDITPPSRRLTPQERLQRHKRCAEWAAKVEELEADLDHARRQYGASLVALGLRPVE
jgi:hypothetical protein